MRTGILPRARFAADGSAPKRPAMLVCDRGATGLARRGETTVPLATRPSGCRARRAACSSEYRGQTAAAETHRPYGDPGAVQVAVIPVPFTEPSVKRLAIPRYISRCSTPRHSSELLPVRRRGLHAAQRRLMLAMAATSELTRRSARWPNSRSCRVSVRRDRFSPEPPR